MAATGRRHRLAAGLLPAFLLTLSAAGSAADDCAVDSDGVVLQVLGSGGPIADDGRASTAYVVWVDGESRLLVDMGGGAFLRFGEAGASFDDLDHIAISHFHTDHAADLVTLLKTGYFSPRTRPLSLSGPGGSGPFPSLTDYVDANVGPNGAYAYLSGYLDGSGGLVRLDLVELDAARRESLQVYQNEDAGIEITAIGVPHGIVPAIAYRVRVSDVDLVFSSDQNGNDASFVEFANGADVLVMHMVVPEGVEGAGRALHAPPSRIGEIASDAAAGKLVLSHFMARSLADLDGNVAEVRQRYDGDIVLADDLVCIDP
jgi:ribonuclease BN (tRNA processing enzyme)